MGSCKDCAPGTRRPAPHPGPRCATHHRQVKRQRRDAAHDKYLRKTYNTTAEEYWRIYDAQGGVCYICGRANGRTKRLSLDHDHECCPETPTCGKCNRGLLDQKCNRDVLGHLRDSVDALQRAIDYLTDPPARRMRREAA